MLIAACHDVSETTGVTLLAYHFSEPQQGKDLCDRLICPMKSAMNKYCNEGNNILSSKDMFKALKQKHVKGTTAAAAKINGSQNTLEIKNIDKFSKLHNFAFEDDGIRVWRAHRVGKGKVIPDASIFVNHQGPSSLEIVDDCAFFENECRKQLKGNTESV